MATADLVRRREERERRREELRLEEEALMERRKKEREHRRLVLEEQALEAQEELVHSMYVRKRLAYLEDDVKRMQEEQKAEDERLRIKKAEEDAAIAEAELLKRRRDEEAAELQAKQDRDRKRAYRNSINEKEEALREERERKNRAEVERQQEAAREARELRAKREAEERERDQRLRERKASRRSNDQFGQLIGAGIAEMAKQQHSEPSMPSIAEESGGLTVASLPLKLTCYKFYCDYWILQPAAPAPEIIDDLDYTIEDDAYYGPLAAALVGHIRTLHPDQFTTANLTCGDSFTRVYLARDHLDSLEALKNEEIARCWMSLQAGIRTFLAKRRYQQAKSSSTNSFSTTSSATRRRY
eukprot:TRINITY_DN1801_c0_g1_i1.p1 TRINITY_DN1801_c0_g1~~TRINITY_DN1801_c0_g1_i1.p1  ORF type:complete len:357 (+),score=110.55 TRINITY_DN1801_c0_g1_i1:335-1405(+)